MNARLVAMLTKPKPSHPRGPLVLAPIPWGRRDPLLATEVMHSVARCTPRMEIPFNTVLSRKLREFLERHGIGH